MTVEEALKNVSEAAQSLAVHGHEGYDVDSQALDMVFLRSLYELATALYNAEDSGNYDPTGDLYYELPTSDYF